MEVVPMRALPINRHRWRRTVGLAAAVLLVAGASACSGDDNAEALEQELAEVTAERDALALQVEERAERRDRGLAILAEITAILDEPESFGTEEEVADLLATHATEAAVMDDEVFGSVNYRDGFYNTLYSDAMDAEIDVYETWMSADGSQGGVLWLWHGTNAAGNSFELAGVSITTHDEEGMITHEYVTYPHDDEYVRAATFGEGT
jgi:hypothetical protein